MVNGTLLNFGKRYEDNLRVIFDQGQKLHFDLDAPNNQKILKGIYYIYRRPWFKPREMIGPDVPARVKGNLLKPNYFKKQHS